MTLFPQEIIRRKRDGAELTRDEIHFMIAGLADNSLADAQVGAFAMAIFFRGMTMAERVLLTQAMTASGTMLNWRSMALPGPILDKHSTGGIGDKVSLILAPIVAACGGFVPMISGRGLGHTGGTLDKLQAIPGYEATPDLATFRRAVAQAGCAIIGQTADLAPADRRLYAIRDVTATVESIPLITASILSKKLAAGLDALVMDVKFGSGAFMPEMQRARELAESIVAVANGAGLRTAALLTDMNQALGHAAGNAVEVRECIDHLTGAGRETRLHEVTVALSAELLVLGKLASGLEEAVTRVEQALASGAAAERFGRMVGELGGPKDLVERPEKHLATAPVVRPILQARAGYIGAVDARAIGLAIMALGGGRARAEDSIDPAVGFTELRGIGMAVGPDAPLGLVHARSEAAAAQAAEALRAAIAIVDAAPAARTVVEARIGPTR